MVHLDVHSHYSLLQGTAGIRQLVARAVEDGMRALALTDTAGMYGVVPFYQAAREAGVQPLLGVKLGSCVVLARSLKGYARLCRLVTAWQLDEITEAAAARLGAERRRHAGAQEFSPFRNQVVAEAPRQREDTGNIPLYPPSKGDLRQPACGTAPSPFLTRDLGQPARDVALSPFLMGDLGQPVRSAIQSPPLKGDLGGCKAAISIVEWLERHGDGQLFVITPHRRLLRALHGRGVPAIAAITHYGDGRSRYQAAGLLQFARDLGLRAVAVNPVYFVDPSHHQYHRVLTAINENATVDTVPPEALAHPGDYFRTGREMERLYAQWPELLYASEGIAEECSFELPLGKPLFPEFPLPEGETPFSWLWKKTFTGLKKRFQPLTPRVIDRVQYELDVINELGFAPYFLIVRDIVEYAEGEGIPVVGRGSAANSMVAYALGITRVDPFKYDLYFERFLNRSRTDCPDIDIDLCWRRRDMVIDYVYRKYGASQVAMISTISTFRARGAVREVAKAHGLTDKEIGRVARLLPEYGARDLRSMVKHLPECRGLDLDAEPLRSIIATSEFIDEFPRHLSVHPCGIVIAPSALTNFTPLQRATKGLLITQYDMGPIEQLGLIKMDLLGHRSLTVIDDTVRMLKEARGVTLDIEAIAPDDPLTAQMTRAGRTIGCFQIESPAMRGLLQKVHAVSTHQMVQTVALVRPGASGSGMKKHFIDRHHGRETVEYLHPALEQVLADTYGIMIYQEDVLKVAHAVAGMDLTEADALRRAISKKRSPRAMAKSMKGFLEKARAQGVDEAVAQEIWELISNFAAYSYCKAHAATYGELAWQCAYLKAHYPAEFFAMVLSNRGGFYTPAVYFEEARRCGITMRPPCVQKSGYAYTVEDEALRVGLVEVRGLSVVAVRAIIEAREGAEEIGRIQFFQHLQDFIEHTRIGFADAELLMQAGALDGFGMPRPVLRWQLQLAYERGVGEKEPSGRLARRNTARLDLVREEAFVLQLPDYSARRQADEEWTALGILTRRHPLDYYAASLAEEQFIASSELAAHAGQRVTLTGWLVAERRLTVKEGGGVMKFLTLEDTQGTFEAVLFPEAYQAWGHLLTTLGPYIITGEAKADSDALAVIVEEVRLVGAGEGQREKMPKSNPQNLQESFYEKPVFTG